MGEILEFAGMLFIYLKVIKKQGVPGAPIIHFYYDANSSSADKLFKPSY